MNLLSALSIGHIAEQFAQCVVIYSDFNKPASRCLQACSCFLHCCLTEAAFVSFVNAA